MGSSMTGLGMGSGRSTCVQLLDEKPPVSLGSKSPPGIGRSLASTVSAVLMAPRLMPSMALSVSGTILSVSPLSTTLMPPALRVARNFL